ncbi:suppressor of fused homolog isoform X2 [Galleria mellonella]|uniref:Suppressor of fused homolog n=1 Tax=Galleria mellonella TaxID=7137 RepID=A0ABM3MWQ9_GALME|nr:suppressor of fused homolog isoform X2 [Galleria mellonella]
MSGASGSGGSGVVRNSALSFVAPAQPSPDQDVPSNLQDTSKEQTGQDCLVPAGLKALCDACAKVYPDQPNPLQVTTRLKYWLGGQDPLDYISMYWNPGSPDEHIPPHWHYISFGLSDLHGDGRVHPAGWQAAAGYGLELTLRLAAPPPPAAPPLWPAALLQALARYVFATGNKFYAGDHISWHAPLDGGGSRLRHLLVAQDPQLPPTDGPFGTVNFLQLVGCTGRELRAAQRGSGFDVLKLISEDHRCGDPWLVTRVSRRASASGLKGRSKGSDKEAAHLAGVTARLRWHPWTPTPSAQPSEGVEPTSPSQLSPSVEQQIKDTLQRGLTTMNTDRTGPEGHMSTDSFEMSSIERALPHVPELMQGSWQSEDDAVEYLDGVHLILNPEGASLLPLAIDGRVAHGRHFTYRGAVGAGGAATLLAPAVGGALTSPARPYACRATWLQILIPKDLAEDMSRQVAGLSALADTDSESDSGDECKRDSAPALPLTLTWHKHKLKISVVHDHDLL